MYKYVICVASAFFYKIVLPVFIGGEAITKVELHGKPTFVGYQVKIVRRFNAYVRNGACIDTECLAAAAQIFVLQVRSMLLATQP